MTLKREPKYPKAQKVTGLIAIGIFIIFVINAFNSNDDVQKPVINDTDLTSDKITKNWSTDISTSPMDDSKTVILTNQTVDIVKYDGYRVETPIIVLRCQENKTDAVIDVFKMVKPIRDSNYNKYAKIQVRLDDQQAETLTTSISTDNDAYFLRQPIGFIKDLMKAEKMVLRYQPYNDSNYTITFDLTGLSEKIKPLREACHW